MRPQPPNFFSLLLVVLLAANYFSTFADLDYTWQIRTGEQIARTGQLQVPESFSYTIAGKPLPDFEWLYELVLWFVWSGFGYGGLKLLKTILVALPLLLVARRLHRDGIGWHGILTALVLAILVLSPAWNLRALYCTTIGLLLVTGWLHDHCTGKRPLSGWLPVVMLLWANTHPGVILGQALLLGAIGWEWLNRWVRLNRPLDHGACWRLTLLGGLGLLATFCCPDPLERLRYTFGSALAHPIYRAFTEMQPLYSFITRSPYTTGLIYVVAALVVVTLVLRFREYRLWEVALLAGLAFLANFAFRSAMDWLLVMLALGLPHLAALLRPVARLRRKGEVAGAWRFGLPVLRIVLELDWLGRRLLRGRLFCFQPFWPVAAVGVLAVLSLIPPLSKRMPRQDPDEWPIAALDRIEALGLRGRFFCPPDYGAYLGWRMREQGQSYVDTRGFFFPPELIEDSLYVPMQRADWQQRLERVFAYGTEYFLLESYGPRGELWRTLKPHVAAPLYRDEQAVLLSATQVRCALDELAEKRLVADGDASAKRH